MIDSNGIGNDYLGLFGKIGYGGKVKNLKIVNINIIGANNSECLGGLCGSGSNINNPSFWDTDTSGLTKGIGDPEPDPNNAIGLPTEQMQIASTFIDAGWDFIDIWAICEGTNYPRLQWLILPADFLCPDGVDFIDYTHFSDYWLNVDCAYSNDCEGADFDLSGCVDSSDLKTFSNCWLEEYLSAPPPY